MLSFADVENMHSVPRLACLSSGPVAESPLTVGGDTDCVSFLCWQVRG